LRPLFPGPDLACQDAVMESEAFISSENICISTSRRTLRGVGSTSRRPGQAGSQGLVFMTSAPKVFQRRYCIPNNSRQGGPSFHYSNIPGTVWWYLIVFTNNIPFPRLNPNTHLFSVG